MGLYITGDTHGDSKEFNMRMRSCNLSSDDILIICGDFGFDWDKWAIIEWAKFQHSYTVLFCDGNHENFDILDSREQVPMFGGTVGRFWNNTYRLMTGQMYDIQGFRTFVFGGAASIDKEWRVDTENVRMFGKLWWNQEIPSQKTFENAKKTLADNGWKFDLFFSHTCSTAVKKRLIGSDNEDFHDPVEDMLGELENLIKMAEGSWKQSFFGHFHKDEDIGNRHCLQKRVLGVDSGCTVFEAAQAPGRDNGENGFRKMEKEIGDLVARCEALVGKTSGSGKSNEVQEIYKALLSGEISEDEALKRLAGL